MLDKMELLKIIRKPRINHQQNIGKRYGRLSVVSIKKYSRYIKYTCQCDCGNITEQYSQPIINGVVLSCGCLHKELITRPRVTPRKDIRTGEAASSVGKVFNYYKRNANRDGRVFKLTRTELYNLIIQNCHYCGSPPNQSARHTHHRFSPAIIFSGIDRKDNFVGYVLENCLPCCTVCNKAKGTMTYIKFKEWIAQLINFNQKDKKDGNN